MIPSERRTDRVHIVTQLDIIWGMSHEHVYELVDELSKKVDADSTDCIKRALDFLSGTIRSLMDDTDYSEQEEPRFFKRYMDDIEDMFKHLLMGFVTDEILERHDKRNSPQSTMMVENQPIDFLCKTMFAEIGEQLGTRIYQRHSGITMLVRHVRNQQKHARDLPLDHVTGVNTCGNIYTLVSTLILSLYAFIEILETWKKIL